LRQGRERGAESWVIIAVGVRQMHHLQYFMVLTVNAGQFGRALGPLIFCTLYWWAGRQTAYTVGGSGMLAVCGLVFSSLKKPAGTEMVGKKVEA
jgi:hypothetical protein